MTNFMRAQNKTKSVDSQFRHDSVYIQRGFQIITRYTIDRDCIPFGAIKLQGHFQKS